MFRHTKTVLVCLASVFALVCLSWVVRQVTPWFAKYQLKSRIAKIEPWGPSTAYSQEGWRQLVRSARVLQECKPALTARVLEEYLQDFSSQPAQLNVAQGRAFLLLRVVFDLPDRAQGGPLISAAGWKRGQSELNPDGSFNQAWPILWNQGHPQLVSGCEGVAGSDYSAAKEFAMFRYRFKLRDLSSQNF